MSGKRSEEFEGGAYLDADWEADLEADLELELGLGGAMQKRLLRQMSRQQQRVWRIKPNVTFEVQFAGFANVE